MCEEEKEVVIVGSGIAGLATALALKRVGVRGVVVLEKAGELRATGAALTLFPNAWQALDALGVAHKLTPIYSVLQKGHVTDIVAGASQEVSYLGTINRSGLTGLRTVHRRVLLEALAEELPPDTIRFSSKLVSIKIDESPEGASSPVVLHLEDGRVIRAKVLIGCDGVHSVVARWLGLARPVSSGRSAVRGMAVYPEGHGFKHEIQQFLGEGRRAGFVPLNDKELYWFIAHSTTPGEQEMARDPELILRHVVDNLARNFPEKFLDVARHSDLSTVSWAPLIFRYPWDLILGNTNKGNVTVAGDAMHPMTPDLGQGGCAALEDAVVLVRNIADCFRGREGELMNSTTASSEKVAGGIDRYVKERRWRAAGLIAGAYLSGWVQQGGSGWWGWAVKFVRDHLFYPFFYRKIVDAVNYDCGSLPTVVKSE